MVALLGGAPGGGATPQGDGTAVSPNKLDTSPPALGLKGSPVPTWLRSGLKFRVQTLPHPANPPLQKLSDSDRSSIYTSTGEGAGAARRPVSMASG